MINKDSLYAALEEDFDLRNCTDEYWAIMDFHEYFTDNFKQRFMGLLMDSADVIEKVYTAVFPSDEVIKKILHTNRKNLLLFLHHPMKWTIPAFQNINPGLLEEMKKNRISIYALHTPLDKNGKYSTSVSLARKLDITPKKGFFDCFGIKVGVIGTSPFAEVTDLAKKVEYAVNHRVKLYQYGDGHLRERRVAVVAGGGNNITAVRELIDLHINTLITGISNINDYTRRAHSMLKEHKINLIGATHYSTEKFACMAMVDYFARFNVEAEFVEDIPGYEDM